MARLTRLLSFLTVVSLSIAASLEERGAPADPTNVLTITSPQGATISYKQPGKQGICETKEGVDDYAGYIRLSPTQNMFFWFFEARENPSEKPLTLWLNGGPGSDSLIGLFQENGPCNVTEDLKTQWNPHSWNEHSNMLYLSQPVGVGFSYETTQTDANGRYSLVDPDTTNTANSAAVGAWHVLQAFLELSPQLDPDIQNNKFNLWTESYGGHYGPAFYNYFYQQNEAIRNGTLNGVELEMDTLGIINGMVSAEIQALAYPVFAMNNTYGIKAVDEQTYLQMTVAYVIPGGCEDQIQNCYNSDRSTAAGQLVCQDATNWCRNRMENPYYVQSGRSGYDIRRPADDPTPPQYYKDFLNLASTQEALGVDLNYTFSSSVFDGFSSTGDFVYPDYKTDLEEILGYGVRVALIYGDADYMCNWYGGEALSTSLSYTDTWEFYAAGYTPFVVDGVEYGEVREYGNFSFTKMYEAGHQVPYYQPEAALAHFKRVLDHVDIAHGRVPITDKYSSNGTERATHTEAFVPLPTN